MATPRLWTIGYAERDLEGLVEALQKAKVDHVADVRQLPLSRKRGMSKGPLTARLEEAGLTYTHLKALGAPKELREPFLRGGDYESFRDGYLAHLTGQTHMLEMLAADARARKTAILCLCADAAGCHRGLVADALQQRGYTVTHL